jgi:phosphatidylinositol phospholipase C gamma-1
MWLNSGRFRQNGSCGLVLKPALQLTPTFNPCVFRSIFSFVASLTYHLPRFDFTTYQPTGKENMVLRVRLISARHLLKPGKGIASPFVEMEISGAPNDCERYKSRIVTDNGFNPVWNESFSFHVGCPDVASLIVTVFDVDMFDDANAIGQVVLPLGGGSSGQTSGLRQGFRSLPLRSIHGFAKLLLL